MPVIAELETPQGVGRLVLSDAEDPRAVLLFGHGAGGGIDSHDQELLARVLPGSGVTVVRFEQPWRTAGRRVAGPPKTLDAAWRVALARVEQEFAGLPLFVGGRSAGARVACRCFAPPVLGVVAVSFPLNPPGRPEKSRAAELERVDAPMLVLQGERDPFGGPDEVRATFASGALRAVRVVLA